MLFVSWISPQEPIQTLDLHGNAQSILDWFEKNSVGITAHVLDVPDSTVEERRKFAIDALRVAVRKDEIEKDYEIIGYDLSSERVSAFRSDVYAAALGLSSIERLFQEIEAVLDLPTEVEGVPNERLLTSLETQRFSC